MKFLSSIENYPSPVIAIDDNMFVAAKNYLASLTFPNLHVGAKITKYTDIDFENEVLAKGAFYGKEYLYFLRFSEIDGQKYTLLFLSVMTFSRDVLGFDPITSYQNVGENTTDTHDSLKNKKRQYVRNVHNKLVKANYFENFKGLFESKRMFDCQETVELKRVCTSLDIITRNYLENLDINVVIDYTMPNLVATISELHITSLLVNSLLFAVINSKNKIDITLNNFGDSAQIVMEFTSDFDFFELYDIDPKVRTDVLNSAFSLCVALEICDRCNIDFSIKREKKNNVVNYTITHSMPINKNHKASFASKDTITPLLEKYLLSVFFNELD